MAIIYTYGFDNNVQDNDAWIGTNADNRKTKQFTVASVANYLNTAGRIAVGGQMTFKFVTSGAANGTISFIGGGGAGTSFADITSLYVSTTDVSGANVTEWLNYLIGSQLLIVEQNTPNQFGHYVINSYVVTGNPNFYNLGLGYIGGNGVLVSDAYYDLVALNIPDGTGSGVDTITTTDSTFISSTPSTPTAGNVNITSSLSATGTPDETTYLRGDNTWAAIPEPTGDSDFVYFTVKNETGVTINKGKGVMAVGTDGNSGHILIDEMIADGTVEAKFFLGVLETSVDNGEFARVISFGQLSQFDTRGQNGETWNDSDILWCDPANPGDFTIVEPDGPNVKIAAAFILNSSTNGKIQIRVQANEGVHDLHDTRIVSQQDGDVLVWNDTDGVWFNDSTLNVDYTNSRVGIGTTSPSQKLHVEGTILVNNEVQFVDSSMRIFRSSNDMRLRIGGSDRMTINSLGNVGIGTTSPAYKLEVNGTTRLNGRLTLGGNVNNFIEGSAGGLQLNSISDFNFVRAANTFVTIKNTGNVGIGTTSPSQRLEVDGDALINNSGDGKLYLGSTSDYIGNIGSNIYMYSSGQNIFYAGGSEQMRITTVGNVGIRTTSPIVPLHVIGDTIIEDTSAVLALKSTQVGSTSSIQFESLSNAAIVGGGSADYLSFMTASNHRMRILANGRVGIGTTSPGAKLDIQSSTIGTNVLKVEGANSNNITRFYDSSVGGEMYMEDSSGTSNVKISTGSSSYFNGGNVGIGTTSPSNPLHVSSSDNILATFESTDSISEIRVKDNTKYTRLLTVGSDFKIMPNDGVEMAVFEGDTGNSYFNGGNVGIGTISPTSKLHVAGSTYSTGGFYTPNSAIGYFTNLSSTAGMLLSSLNGVELVSGGNSTMFLNPSGNVGIGTTSPSEKLDVDGNVKLGATTGRQLMFGENKYGAVRLGNNLVVGGNSAVDIRTGNAALSSQSSRVFINQTGFVGVGTTTPQALLDVNGPIKIGNAVTFPLANTVGTMRYRADSNNSYVEMIMQTGASTYAWVVIKQNTW